MGKGALNPQNGGAAAASVANHLTRDSRGDRFSYDTLLPSPSPQLHTLRPLRLPASSNSKAKAGSVCIQFMLQVSDYPRGMRCAVCRDSRARACE
eukprot:1160213-Pelagomonas_calceolata.AAC.6